MNKIKILAPAKINLSLDINGIRNDGYHELEMIMQTVALYDIIKLKKIPQGIELSTSDENLPEDKDNLAYQAAQLIKNRAELTGGIAIELKKNIPIAAGLAGGSSDAAAVLKGVNKLYDLDYSYNTLVDMAKEIGTDVPFCLKGGTALATGKGDQLVQLPDINSQILILVKPPLSVSTPEIYKKYDKMTSELDITTD